jgi:hypothetical protein
MLAGSIANAKLANSTLTINGSSISLGGSVNAGTLDWQTVIVADGSTSTTGVAGRGYFINTTSAAHTFTLPISATRGDTIAIVDYAQTFATNKLTIARNGHNIQGVANNSLIGTNRASVTLVYVDATKGWVYQDESNVADLQQIQYVTATGGTVATSGNFKIHTFTGDGCFVVSCAGNTAGSDKVDYLVVAGGGAGGSSYVGAGGGAGGYRTTFPSPGCNAGSFPVTATTFPITVGSGGALNTSGSNSVFSTITSTGGGKGGPFFGGVGEPGGSGGGGGSADGSPNALLSNSGTGNTPPVSPSQGNNGGNGWRQTSQNGSGGGGGASTTGGNGAYQVGGNGGSGSTNSISTSPVTYAGGGGGGAATSGTGGTGGPGGGGAGRGSSADGGNGTANTGGGGGGSGYSGTPNTFNGGTGGSGIVLIRYKFQ